MAWHTSMARIQRATHWLDCVCVQFEKAATKLADEEIKLAKVDCTTDGNKELCGRFGVTGYPTIKFFK